MARAQRRLDRLKVLLRRLPGREVDELQIGGVRCKLPLKFEKPEKPVSREELAYLAGFFDGDGCVSPTSRLSSCSLQVRQAAKSGGVLARFGHAFGGSLRGEKAANGAWQPTVVWALHGSPARDAAEQLAPVCYNKFEQLQVSASWPRDHTARVQKACFMKALKRMSPGGPSNFKCGWSYFTGFFDAEGSICVDVNCRTPRLILGQKYDGILNLLSAFLASELSHEILVQRAPQYFRAECTRAESCRHILRMMLKNGLEVKAATARTVLALSEASHADIRSALTDHGGNQTRYYRLDEAGCQRSRRIKTMKGQLARALKAQHANDVRALDLQQLQLELDNLIEEHKFLNLITWTKRIRSDIRSHLLLQRALEYTSA